MIDSSPEPIGPPDRQTLRLLEKHLWDDPLVVKTVYEPDTHQPRTLRVELAVDQYPERVRDVRLNVRWFTSGDFSIHYLEIHDAERQWECRWDRHPNDHNDRTHFHRPPTGREIENLPLPSLHPLEVYSTVLGAIEQRIESLWSS